MIILSRPYEYASRLAAAWRLSTQEEVGDGARRTTTILAPVAPNAALRVVVPYRSTLLSRR